MKKTNLGSIRQFVRFGVIVGAIALSACSDDTTKDGSVFDADGTRSEARDTVESTPILPNPDRDVIAQVLSDTDAFSRARRLAELLPTLGPGPLEELAGILADPKLSLHIGGTEIELLTRYWATHDPRGASTWAVNIAPPAYRSGALFSTFPVWAKSDPTAALEAANTWTERRELQKSLQAALVMGWYAADDPRELQSYMENLGRSFAQQRALSAYVRAKLRFEGANAVMHWAEAISEENADYKSDVYQQVGYGIAPYDLDAALSFCDAHCTGPYGQNLRGAVIRGWMTTDPRAAMKWLLAAPQEGHEARFALRVAYATWLKQEREDAMRWVAEQSIDGPPAVLTPTFPNYARALGKDSPAEAIPFAELIADEMDKDAVLKQLATAWWLIDKAACDEWLSQSSLSMQARTDVRATLAPSPI